MRAQLDWLALISLIGPATARNSPLLLTINRMCSFKAA
jgi:hypothetical protein